LAVDDLTRIQPIKRTSLALRSQTTGQLHELSGEMLVGREVECDIQLSSLQISRYHAKIFVSANGLFIEDLKSSNGTFVNGHPIKARTTIGLGDQVAFDEIKFRITTANSGETDRTQLAFSQKVPAADVGKGNRNRTDRLIPPEVPRGKDREARVPTKPQPAVKSPESEDSLAQTSREPKVHEIPDMEEFLRFAGSGLKAQQPLSTEQASPFGLERQKRGLNPPDIITDKDSAGSIGTETKLPSVDKAQGADLSRELIKSPKQRESAVKKPAAVRCSESVTPPQQTIEDEDRTKYLSLNAMDRYVSTNQQYQQDLKVGSGPRLVVMTAPIRGKVFLLQSNEDVKCWSIGRDDSSDVCLRDKAVSREHAWITKLDCLYQLRVNDGASGILVNGETSTEVELHHGDRLQFGAMELVFRLDVHQSTMDSEHKNQKGWLARMRNRFAGKGR